MSEFSTQDVIGVGVSVMDYQSACDAILAAALAKQRLTVTALAVHGIMTGALDREHRSRLNALDMVLADGQPVRWAVNLLGRAGLTDRVYGPNLMLIVCEQAQRYGLSIGLYGNRSDVLDELRCNLILRIPNLRIEAVMPSRFERVAPEEQAELAHQIEASGVDILFVGLGCPRQEVWLYENRDRLNLPTIAVGAAFDFHAKRLAQAPRWMQDRGLEWLFRLAREPRRLWQRYLLLNPLFVTMLILQLLRLRSGHQDAHSVDVRYKGYA